MTVPLPPQGDTSWYDWAQQIDEQGRKAATAVQSVNGETGAAVSLTKAHVGLNNVNNTADVNKPVSSATQAALDAKVNAASLAPVATSGSAADLTSGVLDDARIPASIARDSETQAAIDALIGGAPGTRDTLKEISDALSADEGALSALTSTVAGKTDRLTQRAATATSSTTATANEVVPLDTTSGALTLTGPGNGAPFGARWKAGAATATIAAPTGYTINGQPSISMGLAPGGSSGELVVWQASGTDYQPVSGFKPQSALDIRHGVVALHSVIGDGAADDTAAINAVLAAAPARSTVRGVPGRTYLISAPLVMRPGGRQTLDMTGCTITLKPGSNCNMLQNAAVANSTRTVADAAITAGTTALTSATVAFTSADVGRSIVVQGAAGGGGPLCATITTVTSATAATLSVAAATTVSAASAALYDRDRAVHVVGGVWDRGTIAGAGTNLHSLMLRRVDGLVVRDLEVRSGAGKYALAVGDVTNYTVERLHFACHSDGVHVAGPARGGYVADLTGTTGDDMLAFTAKDWNTYLDVQGDIVGCTTRGLFPTASLAALKIISGTGTAVRDLDVTAIYGTTTIRPIAILDDTTGPTDVSGIRISDVDAMTLGNDYLARINCSAGKDVTLRDVHWRTGPTAGPILLIDGAANLQTFIVDGLHLHGAISGPLVVKVGGTATVGSLALTKVRAPDTVANTTNLVDVPAGATITSLRLTDLEWYSLGGSLVFGGGAFGAIELAHVRAAGPNLVRISRTSGITQVRLHDVDMEGGGTGGFAVESYGPIEIDVTNSDLGPSNTVFRAVGASATLDVRGFYRNSRNKPGVGRDGTQAIRLHSFDLQADVSLLSKTAGDMAYNTNASLACGVGPVICDGTNWKHLFTGATV